MGRTGRRVCLLVMIGLALIVPSVGCRGRERPPRRSLQGPIVLITIDTLRADHVGALGGPARLTPHLDRLASEATWAGRAITPSSWTVPSMCSLFTGFQPGATGNWSFDRTVIPPRLVTLPQSLKAQGYRTVAFRSNIWLMAQYGYGRGFDRFETLGDGRHAEEYLERLDGGPDFVWIHLLPPHAPYIRRPHLLGRLTEVPPRLPVRVRTIDLEPYRDPSFVRPSPEQLSVFRAMYALNVAWADERLGRLLDALRRSGQWDRTLLAITSDHGEELGEYGQMAHGNNLRRHVIEVPLMIKLPAGFRRALRLVPGRPVGTIRLHNTLVEAAGGEPARGTQPGLFEEGATGVLSGLYMDNGVNFMSWVEGDRQLLWTAHFAQPEPDFYRARVQEFGGHPDLPPVESFAAINRRLEEAMTRTLPLTGLPGQPPTLTLWRWTAGDSEELDDPREAEAMARHLKRAWIAANGPEKPFSRRPLLPPPLSPEEEAELRNLGYIH